MHMPGIYVSTSTFPPRGGGAPQAGMRRPVQPQGLNRARAPLGYRLQGGQLVEDPQQSHLIRTIFSLYLAAHSLRRLKHLLDREAGKPEGQAGEQSFRTISKVRLHRILRDPVYMGGPDASGAVPGHAHPALVDRSTWAKVQDLLSSNRR